MSKRKITDDIKQMIDDQISELIESTNKRLKQIENNYNSFLSILTDKQIFRIFDECNYNMINNIISNKTNFDINIVFFGKTFLFDACYNGHNEVVRILLAQSATDVNLGVTNYCNTSFIHATINGHETTDIGSTPLIVACEKGHCEVVELLLAHPKTDVNKTMSVNGSTPLTMACWKGHYKVVELLLAHPMTDVNKTMTMTNSWDLECQATGATPLIIACKEGHERVVQLLLSHPKTKVNQATTDDYGFSPFFCACFFINNGVVKLLLDHPKTDVNQVRKFDGQTPLCSACEYLNQFVGKSANEYANLRANALETVQLLLTHPNTNVNQANTIGDTPLDITFNNHYGGNAAVKLLLSDSRTIRIRPTNPIRIEVYDRELRNVKSIRRAKFRGLIRAAIVFKRMQLRAALKVYAPGGAGFQAASASFTAAIDR